LIDLLLHVASHPLSLFGAITWTHALNVISLAAPQSMQGKVMGLSQSVSSLSMLIAPIFTGIVAGVNLVWIYPAAALILLISQIILSRGMVYAKK